LVLQPSRWDSAERTGVLATIVFGIVALPLWWNSAPGDSAIQLNEHGSIVLSSERRNAIQCAQLEKWLDKTQVLRKKHVSMNPPSDHEYQTFIRDFVQLAEVNFTPEQISEFNRGLGSGIGVTIAEKELEGTANRCKKPPPI